MILIAKGLGVYLKHGEDYYGEPDEDTPSNDIDGNAS